MGKNNHTSANPPAPRVVDRPISDKSLRLQSLPKLTIPFQQPIATPPLTAYYDAYDYLSPAYYTAIEPESECKNGGLGKSLIGLCGGVQAPASTTSVTPTIKSHHGPIRGVSKAVAYEHTQASFTRRSAPLAISVPRLPKKKALLIGTNYKQRGSSQLRYAIQDARRFAATLSKLGYSDENIQVVTDEPGQQLPSREYLLECMDRLVQDALPGDQLFFVYAGHCEPSGIGKPEAYFVTANSERISRSTFQDRLIAKVPEGAELTMVLDCCNAAAMVPLKYCIGRMESEQQSTMMKQASVGTFVAPGRKIGGVVEAPPLSRPAAPNPSPPFRPSAPTTGMPAGMKGAFVPVNQPASIDRRRSRHLVVEGRPVWQFEERTCDFVSPAGKIVVYAASAEFQKAFEASGRVGNGVLTNAICNLLDTCNDKIITQREVWHSVVAAIGEENHIRRQRDENNLNKTVKNIPLNQRWQYAQMWASQQEPLDCSSPLLDQPFFGNTA
ncbi:ICE-like protease (caspase) p20 domain protein [Rhizoctonia solani AG-3 Rhs1AP]|uniref:ICE-like protease (Caspase) p20 domain protein n=1 Tax=Rhizoctonia solani AG-3 Rhs1AP TaxID=1086054 RepID=X8J8C4_9AGAM|nr:ICE-like protease (caspase) p20 domain protein [Rhizoctonia solani AG-3 Rhs1AP]